MSYFLGGQFKLEVISHDMKMGTWVNAPVLIDTKTDTAILDLKGDVWDLRGTEEGIDSITLTLARYPDGNKKHKIKLYPLTGEASINGNTLKIHDIHEMLDTLFD